MVRDMAGDVRLLAELKREAARDEIVAPDIYYAALMAGETFFADPRTHESSRGLEPGTAPWMRAMTAATDVPQAIAEAKGSGATAIKLYADLPASLVAAITAEAHRQHMLVWAHAAVFPARPSDVADAGVDVMSHADFLAFESITPFPESFQAAMQTDLRGWKMSPAVDAVLAKMKDRGTILDATVDVGYRNPVPQWPSANAPLLAREAYHRGIRISAGTDDDADWSDPNSALLVELERLVREVGMTTADALRSATIIGARTIGEQDTAGVLAEGRVANFVVLASNPLSDIHNLRSVVLVVKNGIPHARSAYRPVTVRDMSKNRGQTP
jgi:imidazolonepropionase-like amidohydrolase